ncbi:glycosyltransferase family 117 protein [Pedobacter sp. AW31-3R]|uniref:glycosyltransferase family 117 protein n=1 Tax=Pedobacter sp. AW31-3R TaxID=3445781 RepID=UPI003FA054D3
MKLSARQQLEIRNHLMEISISAAIFDELYDHVLTTLEHQKDSRRFNMKEVRSMIDTEFKELINTPEEKKTYQRINNIAGFVLFAIALLTYGLTMEPTVSFWDCGEFIAAADKMQVGHQPGAPLFLIIGKLFSLFAIGNTAKVAWWINFSAVLSSAATIMFLFWTITALASRLYRKEKLNDHLFSIMACGTLGALAYTFSDTFWFSAVEAEVYALSSLFTAVAFWAILKWESQSNDKWLIFIAFIAGLSTGIHLLTLLVIPAITLVYYFKKTAKQTLLGTAMAFAAGCVIVGLVQFVVIQYFVLFAAKTDLLFVNTFGLPFGSGALFFVLLFCAVMSRAIYYSVKHQKYNLNLGLLCTVFLMFGFSAYFMILIRANAKTDINLSNPDHPFSLYSYLGRTNYGQTPLLYGNTFDAKLLENQENGNTYRKGKSNYEISGKQYNQSFDKNLIFPRTYSQKAGHPEFYRSWLHLAEGETPSMLQNLRFFSSWQIGFMYWRYFLWNFAGRQNDVQGQGGIENGNWITGIKPLDSLRLGEQGNLPKSISSNEGHNVYFALPLLLGIAGFIFLYRKNKRDSLVILTLFFFTGIAIILYLNQDPLQVRERDYAYAGSFYAFAICIGFGLLALKEILTRITFPKLSLAAASVICLFAAPGIMATQGWDDHNRSNKTTARSWAKNYLNSCAPNAILFTNADNDTYPLWYAQEVEGIRTDVRVVCIQFLSDADYINQMKKQMNNSAPLPISMTEEKYADGIRDYLPFVDYGIQDSVELKDLLAVMNSDNKEDKVQMSDGSLMNFLPTRKFKLTVDSDQLVRTQTIRPEEKEQLTAAMEWDFTKAYVGKVDLAMLDILATNNWKRPVYFATRVSGDTYLGLDKYLYLEGYAFRLLPFKTEGDERDKESKTHTEAMYAHMMHQLDFSDFHKAAYLDPESRRVLNSTWDISNTLAANLLTEGKPVKAQHIMQKSMKELPLRNYGINDTLGRMYTAQNLYALKNTGAANKVAKDTADYVVQELEYIAALEPEFQQARMQQIRLGLYVLSGLDKLTKSYQQHSLNQAIGRNFNYLANEFGFTAG